MNNNTLNGIVMMSDQLVILSKTLMNTPHLCKGNKDKYGFPDWLCLHCKQIISWTSKKEEIDHLLDCPIELAMNIIKENDSATKTIDKIQEKSNE